jgi:DNA-binding transcriptional regulator YdaS (Cro superfamily)
MNADAQKIREVLERVGMSQRAAARFLGVKERAMRYYCTGKVEVPKVVVLAVEHLECGQDKMSKIGGGPK